MSEKVYGICGDNKCRKEVVAKADLIDLIYPVGSIYMSAAALDPTFLFGGTWEQWGSGRVPVGVDRLDDDFKTVNSTGGYKKVQPTGTTRSTTAGGTVGGHTLTVNEMPKHGHPTVAWTDGEDITAKAYSGNGVSTEAQLSGVQLVSDTGFNLHDNGFSTRADAFGGLGVENGNAIAVGGGGSHTHAFTGSAHTHTFIGDTQDNMPPYITCYMWRRRA